MYALRRASPGPGCGLGILIPHNVFIKSFFTSQFSHKSVNLFFIITNIKNKLTDLERSKAALGAPSQSRGCLLALYAVRFRVLSLGSRVFKFSGFGFGVSGLGPRCQV